MAGTTHSSTPPHREAAPPQPTYRRSWAWRLGHVVIGLLVALGAILVVASVTTEYAYWSRILAWRDADYYDFANKFPPRPIPNGAAIHDFAPAPAMVPSYLATATAGQPGNDKAVPLDALLAANGTTAFIVVKDDQLLYERYFNGSSRQSLQTSFSVAKSFGSTLIGIAIGEGLIASLDDPITRYLPELASRPGLDQVRVRHIVSMTSGLLYNGTGAGGGPFDDDARTYYDPDLRALALTVRAEVKPGTRWQYNNFHPLLLGLILERATGRSVSAYLSEKLWQPLGMEAPGSWSLDSRHDGFEKMESGLNGRAIDFAKFGRLFLHGGMWEGRQLVPSAWVEAATHHDPAVAGPGTSPAGEEWARSLDYGYMWWIDPKAPGRFSAMGNFGQYIYVAPDRNVVIVRFGTSRGDVAWLGMMRDLASRVP